MYLHTVEIKISNFLYNKWIDSVPSKFTALGPSLGPFISSPSSNPRPPRSYSEPWIYQGCEYAAGSKYPRVLNMLGLRRAMICLNISK